MHKDPQITRLIHENFWIIISYALARPVLTNIINDQFRGEWKYLNKTVYEISEIRADRALLEMAAQIRVLDDHENLNEYFKQVGKPSFGNVVQGDGTETDLHLRDMTNKILHAAHFEWDLGDQINPKVKFHPHDPKRWKHAELHLIDLMGFVGELMH